MTDVSDAAPAAETPSDAPVPDEASTPEPTETDPLASVEEGLSSGSLSPEEGLKQIKELRKEQQRYRERFQPLEQAFTGVHPDDMQFFTTLAGLAASGNRDGLVEAFEQAITVLRPPAEEPAADEEPPAEKSVDEIVAEKVNEILAQRDQQSEEQQIQRQITAKMEDLGYSDPSDATARLVLFTAQEMISAEPGLLAVDAIQKAHEQIDSRFSEKAVEYAKSKAKTAPAVSEGNPPTGEPNPDMGITNPIDRAAELAKRRLLAEASQRAGRDMT